MQPWSELQVELVIARFGRNLWRHVLTHVSGREGQEAARNRMVRCAEIMSNCEEELDDDGNTQMDQ